MSSEDQQEDQSNQATKPWHDPELGVKHPVAFSQDIYSGLGGLYAAAKGIALQAHKRSFDDYTHGLEREKRIGLGLLGHDVPKIDQEIAESRGAGEDDEVDSSVNISGDTHIHVAPGQEIPKLEVKPGRPPEVGKPDPPASPPQQPPPTIQPPTNRMPAWGKWLLAAALAGSGLGPALTAYFLRQQNTDQGGSVFAFDTQLPPWMTENQE